MKHLIPLMKKIELELRANKEFSQIIWEELSVLTEWEYRIIQDFILRVNMAKQSNDMNFVFKFYEKHSERQTSNLKEKVDLVIAILKRDQKDTVLTDAWNRLVIPSGVKHKTIEIWGMPVTKARNLAVEQSLKINAKYLLFIDDDIIAPNNGLLKLYNLMEETNSLVTSGLYYKKVEPLEAPFENENGQIKIDGSIQKANKICGMGFCLINIEEITKNVPLPLFWEFGSPDGYWSMGEDAFFTMNLIEYTNNSPIVDTSIKCLHMDKNWKKLFGERDDNVVYASGIWDHNDIDSFERMRVPPKYPLVLICIPTRNEKDPIAVNLDELIMLRGYRSELFRVWGQDVDSARNICAEEALKREADYLLFIDDDIIPTAQGLTQLLDDMEKTKGPVVSGNYHLKGKPTYSVHTQLDKEGIVTAINRLDEYKKGNLIKSNWLIGLGFCLINTNVFRQMRKPYFQCYSKTKDANVNEDAHFTELCFENGYTVYIDPNVECLHVNFKDRLIYGSIDKDSKYASWDAIIGTFKAISIDN